MKVLKCEGYMMFEGTAMIKPKSDKVAPFTLSGVWLFKPDTGCWYCSGRSFGKDIVFIQED